MIVRVHILYGSPGEDDRRSLVSLGRSLTNAPQSVVVCDGKPGWLIVEFTMPTEAQYKAVDNIYQAIRLYVENRKDSTIEFPRSAEEQDRIERKAERRRERRRL